ncbi:MAG: hypothetical protein Q9195_008439 [Heterodermia aff. obscurata]
MASPSQDMLSLSSQDSSQHEQPRSPSPSAQLLPYKDAPRRSPSPSSQLLPVEPPRRLVPVVAPTLIHPLARSVTASTSTTARTLGLSLEQYATFDENGYSNTWLADLRVKTKCLDVFTSKHKLNLLVQEGVLVVGDQIYLEIEVMDGEVVVDNIERWATITSVARGHLPNLALYHPDGTQGGTLTACSGPSQILEALRKLGFQTEGEGREPWKQLKVRRGGEEFGTLDLVRQAFHRWQIEMKAWGAWKGGNE